MCSVIKKVSVLYFLGLALEVVELQYSQRFPYSIGTYTRWGDTIFLAYSLNWISTSGHSSGPHFERMLIAS